MPTTRKQKNVRKSRGAEMLSDIENLDIMLEGNRLEREESEYGGFNRRIEDQIALSSTFMKTMKKINTLIVGKVDRVTVPNTATSPLALTLVLSLIGYQGNLT